MSISFRLLFFKKQIIKRSKGDFILITWFQFVVCALIVIFAGIRLAKYGNRIAEATGLSKAWFGIILMAGVTTLPEIFTSVGAVTFVDAPDLALGNIFGSIAFNLVIIAFLDLLQGKGTILREVDRGLILSAGLSIILISIAALNIFLGHYTVIKNFWNVSIGNILIFFIYIIGTKLTFYYRYKGSSPPKNPPITNYSLPITIIFFLIAAIFVIMGSISLASLGDRIAIETGWGKTFVGSVFLAIITSLPEISTTSAAVKLGAFDLAMGNLLGSNIFNTLIIGITDLVYRKGALLSAVSQNQIFTAVLSIVMTNIVIVGLIYRSKKTIFKIMGWDSLALVITYLIGISILFNIS